MQNEPTHFAPRIGIVYQMLKDTVVRAGYGRVYGQDWSGDTFGEVLTFSFPMQVSQNRNAATHNSTLFNLTQDPPSYTVAPFRVAGTTLYRMMSASRYSR